MPDFPIARISPIVGVRSGCSLLAGCDPTNRYKPFDWILLDTGGFRGIL